MEKAFAVTDDGGVSVTTPEGAIARQRVPEDVSPEAFRNALATVDLYWNSEGRIPNAEEAHAVFPRLSKKTFRLVFTKDEFYEALDRRGIRISKEVGLTERQAFALSVLSDYSDKRSTRYRLADIGVAMAEFQAWMRDENFAAVYRQRAENNLKDIVPRAIQVVAENVDSGDLKSAEFALKMTGRYDPNAQEVANARTVVMTLVESIMRRVTDPEVRAAILGDVEGTMVAINVKEALKPKEIG